MHPNGLPLLGGTLTRERSVHPFGSRALAQTRRRQASRTRKVDSGSSRWSFAADRTAWPNTLDASRSGRTQFAKQLDNFFILTPIRQLGEFSEAA